MKISGTDLENLDDTTTQEEYKEVSSESRARNLAIELSKEKKRLKQELGESKRHNHAPALKRRSTIPSDFLGAHKGTLYQTRK